MYPLVFAFLTAISMTVSAADLKKGKSLSKRVCASCHGKDGVSRAPVFPNLSGQSKVYILKQLRAFKSGERVSNSMSGVVTHLEDESFIDVAAYYASHGKVEDTTTKIKDKEHKNVVKTLPVCITCHGANGMGISPLFPNLAGQKDRYLMKELERFKDGRRKDVNMAAIAANLSKKDIKALAKFYSKAGKVVIVK